MFCEVVCQVVLSPHVYGPFVTSAPTAWAGPDLYARLTASFGHATVQGVLPPARHPSWCPQETSPEQLLHQKLEQVGAARGKARRNGVKWDGLGRVHGVE